MARKRDDELINMTLRQLQAYSDTNPAEGLRISKACSTVKKYAAKKHWEYQKSKIIETLIPGFNDEIKFE
ncbi:hypothetical protein ACFSCX_00235 [Bacillus salitolerans]|uniref:Uncharacterized protein n=1 Tax=Bacillus salitolerans TaxID=1437434 RepID=A0ABW4LLT1_9BACI